MTALTRILGIAALFIAVTIATVFATDVLTADGGADQTTTTLSGATGTQGEASSTTTAVAADIIAGGAGPVDVVTAYWVDS